jgi:lysophospholipase L1-like esterase
MRKTYNVLAITLLAGVVFVSSISPAFAEETPSVEYSTEFPFVLEKGLTHFTDVKAGTDLAEAVQFLYNNGFAQGYGETFGVNTPIKRVDFAVILGTYMALDTNVPKASFRDLPTRASGIVSALQHKGIVNGITTTYFGSGENITRGAAALMLHNAFKDYFHNSDGLKIPFTDVSSRYEEAVRVLYGSEIIKGINNTKYGTSANITRGQMALFIHRIYEYQQMIKNEAKSGFVAFGDSNTSGSYFGAQFPESLGKKWTDQVAAVYGDGLEQDVYNAGFSGDQTKEGLARFQEEVLDVKPQSVTIMFGINDALLKDNGQPQISKEEFKDNLMNMVTKLRARQIKVVLMTNTPVVEKTYYDLVLKNGRNIPPLYTSKSGLRNWINSYNDIIRQVANEQAVPLVDTHNILVEKAGGATDSALIKSGFLDNLTGIHMTPKANDVIAIEVKEVLAK